MSSKKYKRVRLLLDESLPPKESYPRTNNYHSVVHIVHDVRGSGSSDLVVYNIARKQNRLPIVFNIKDYRSFIKPNTPSVISLSANLSNKQADLKICNALRSLRPSEIKGHLISISNLTIVVKRMI